MSTSRPPRLPHTTHLEQAAAQLWGAVRAADEYTATGLVLRLLDEGAEPESVLLDVIARVQGKVGEEWAANRITVAQEHAATAINERAVMAVSMHPAALIAHLHSTWAEAVALSSSIATRMPTAHAAITVCQAVGIPPTVTRM